jgi:hypothetical protein
MAGKALTVVEAGTPAEARALVAAIPNTFEAGQIVDRARALNPELAMDAGSAARRPSLFSHPCAPREAVVFSNLPRDREQRAEHFPARIW